MNIEETENNEDFILLKVRFGQFTVVLKEDQNDMILFEKLQRRVLKEVEGTNHQFEVEEGFQSEKVINIAVHRLSI